MSRKNNNEDKKEKENYNWKCRRKEESDKGAKNLYYEEKM